MNNKQANGVFEMFLFQNKVELADIKEESEALKKQLATLNKEKDELKEIQRKITAERDAERIQKEQSRKEKHEVTFYIYSIYSMLPFKRKLHLRLSIKCQGIFFSKFIN